MIRLANTQDFEVFTLIRNDCFCDLLYQSNGTTASSTYKIDIETQQQINNDFAITKDDFLRLLSDKKYRVFMLESDVVIGFLLLSFLGKGRWKVYEICVLPQYQAKDLFFDTLEDLKNLRYIHQVIIDAIYLPMHNLIKEICAVDNFITSH